VFRSRWIVPPERKELLGQMPDGGRSVLLVQKLDDMIDYDLYDVLAELGYGLNPRTRIERAEAFTYKNKKWLSSLPEAASATLKAMAGQFARGGTDSLENPHIFQTPEVARAGGLATLKALGKPVDVLRETKKRMFAA
jgi:type I restriction enzyme R subunit